MKYGQRIAIDVGYQDKMTDFVLEIVICSDFLCRSGIVWWSSCVLLIMPIKWHRSIFLCIFVEWYPYLNCTVTISFIHSLNHWIIHSFISFLCPISPSLFLNSTLPPPIHILQTREPIVGKPLFTPNPCFLFFPSTHSIESKFSHLPISCIFLPMHPIRFFPSIPPKCTWLEASSIAVSIRFAFYSPESNA